MYRDQFHQQRLDELYDFEREKFPPVVRSRTPAVPLSRSDRRGRPGACDVYHKLCFLEDKLYRIRSKIFADSMSLIKPLQELLESKSLIPANYLLLIETQRVFDDILSDKPKLSAIKCHYRALYSDFKLMVGRSPSPEQQHARINAVLTGVMQTVDSSITFFPQTQLQQDFDRLIFLPNSCCFQKLSSLIQNFPVTKPQDFLSQVIDVAEILAGQFRVRDNMSLSVIVTLLMRTIFDEVYFEVDVFKPEIDFIDILGQLRHLTVKDLEPPLEYCPPMNEDDLPGPIFHANPDFRRAIDCLEATAFYTNPLDIIYQFHLALKEIEKAADKNLKQGTGRSLLLAFDVTFGLLLCCLLGAAMPEYIRIAEFTKLYAPPFLHSSFEFALAKIKACTAHLTMLCQQKVDSEKSK
jgi:hypothetical protein